MAKSALPRVMQIPPHAALRNCESTHSLQRQAAFHHPARITLTTGSATHAMGMRTDDESGTCIDLPGLVQITIGQR